MEDETNPRDGCESGNAPAFDLALRADPPAVVATLVLHKLIKTDPIVAGRNPNDIEQAFQEIVSIAPEASKHEPLLRSMLRRRLESGQQIDDFSLNQMLTMEERIRDQRKEYSVVPKLTGLDGAKESPR